MKIRIEHQYIGAALMQVAEHPQFTAINSMVVKNNRINNAFKINNDIGLLCKYASSPNSRDEYLFTFQKDHLDAVSKINKIHEKAFIALICVQDAEICCISTETFNTLVELRTRSAGEVEDHYQILVTAKEGSSLRAYVNAARRKGVFAGKQIVVARNAFPNLIFE